MTPRITPRTPSGFLELLPEEQLVFQRMLRTIQETYELYGFAPIETPAIEYAEVLLAKGGGETEKEMYRFQKGDNDLALHFDLTVPAARYTAEHLADLTLPFRRYQLQKVWRAEKPQKGRQREFYQCDIDIIGSRSILDDAEIPSVIYTVFQKLGFQDFVIRMNNRKLMNGFFAHLGCEDQSVEMMRLIDKLEKRDHQELKQEMQDLGVSVEAVEHLFDLVMLQGSWTERLSYLDSLGIENGLYQEGVLELRQVTEAMIALGVPETHFEIDLSITRGLDYYTGTVYETRLTHYPHFGSVCSGGRYDNLVGQYTEESLPGVGISIGLTRLFSQLLEEKIISIGAQTPARVLVARFSDQDLPQALDIARLLRESSIATEVYATAEKFGKQLKYAHKKGFPFVVIVGASEAEDGQVMLKDMQSGEQQILDIKELLKVIS